MLHGLAKLLTLLSVLLHAVMGCCAHHDHCSGLSPDSAVKQSSEIPASDLCSCSFHTQCEEESGEPGDSSCPCGGTHDGCSDHCSWLTSPEVELPSKQGLLPLELVCHSSSQCSEEAQVALALHGWPPLLIDSGDSICAKTQVWRL